MLSLFPLILVGVLVFFVGAAFFFGVTALWSYARALQLGEPRTVLCPETRAWADVSVDGRRAARAERLGCAEMPLVACSRWPERHDCAQGCTPQVPFLGDDRTLTHWAPWGLEPRFLRVNNPVRMTPALYARIAAEFIRPARAKP
jgi:hypothetical protein